MKACGIYEYEVHIYFWGGGRAKLSHLGRTSWRDITAEGYVLELMKTDNYKQVLISKKGTEQVSVVIEAFKKGRMYTEAT